MADALTQNVQLANALAQMGQLVFGKPTATTTTSGSTTTQQTMFDPTAVNSLMQQLLGASGIKGTGKTGVAGTAGMSKSAGLYNSSTQDLLNNDLISRITGEISIAGAPTVRTDSGTTSKTKQAGMLNSNLMLPLALLAGTSAGKKLMKKASSTAGNFSDSLLDAFGMGPNSGVLAGETLMSPAAGAMSSVPAADMVGGLLPASALADMNVGSGVSAAGGVDAASAMTDAATGFGAAAGTLDAANAVGAAGGDALGTFIEGNAANWGVDTAATVAGTAAAADAGFTLAGFGIEDLAVAGLGCFITTAIMRALGSSDDNGHELTVLRNYRDSWLMQQHPEDVKEYYRIAPEIVDKINAHVDKKEIWDKLYQMHLVPALRELANGNNESAYQIYKQMVMVAKEIA